MPINTYLDQVKKRFASGIATEHSYRADLQTLINDLVKGVTVTNEPKRVTCGAPDYIITRKDIPIGFIEAKDVGKDLSDKVYKEQFNRYKKSLDNLIITDYLDFELYINGKFVISVEIAKIRDDKVIPIPENFDKFTSLINDFCRYKGQTIKSASRLSIMMADKAKMLAEVIEKALLSDDKNEENSTLYEQFEAFQQILIHDITLKGFADIYAQTIAYGMFAARLHDKTPDDFNRKEAAELIPKTNPFLRRLFQYISGYDIDSRIEWIVDALAELFKATDLNALLKDFGTATQTKDPFIHFYETFLAEYDPKLRKSRGVWYTPEPVVNFIVRAVDDILQTEFNLPQGLADTSKTKIVQELEGTAITKGRNKGKAVHKKIEVHKVQILDPATGTGTFLAEVVKQIHNKFKGQQGLWSNYVEDHLIPRLNGFEILMASYSMAHLKLEMLLDETGYKPKKEDRLNIYLTNSLEEHHPDTGTLFASWLSREANEANRIKRDNPVMVVLGNPPYSGISTNMGDWICKLIEDYKYIDGEHFGERKHWLHDDYVKFIRYGQHFVEKNGEGILAFINNHGFIDNPTFRGMRWNLLKTFDKIYIIDLHGNSRKKEVCPDGSKDENVFDITAGVSINIFVKTGMKKAGELGKVYHYDLYGKRKEKYDFLWENSLNSTDFKELNYKKPYYFFVPKDNKGEAEYVKGFKIDGLFKINSTGIVTARDSLVINFKQDLLLNNISYFANEALSDNQVRSYFFPNKKAGKYLVGDSRGWKLTKARIKIMSNQHHDFIKDISYRPFDIRNIYYTSDMVDWGREKIMQHFLKGENVGLVTARSNKSETCDHFFISKNIMETKCGERTTQSAIFPLYLYPDDDNDVLFTENSRMPNLDMPIVNEIATKLDLTFTDEKESTENTFAPIDILDYIYAVLHSPAYRDKYKEFLKIDFPRVPYPENKETFWQLVKLGGEIRQLHLLESPDIQSDFAQYPIDGDNIISRKIGKADWEVIDQAKQLGRIWINDEQYFDNIPVIAWEFYIGGYQPAQKWLKDRRTRELSYDDIRHYQKIIVALSETDRLMKEIDKINFFKMINTINIHAKIDKR